MGIRNALRLVRDGEATTAAVQAGMGLASPWAPEVSPLAAVVWQDIHGDSLDLPMSRSAAMAVPPVAAARHLICPAIARMDLVAYAEGTTTPREDQPGWLTRTEKETGISPFHRMLWTVDDVLFHGWSLWLIRRGAESDGSPILAAQRCPRERWDFDDDGRVMVDDRPVQASQVLLIPGPHEGILSFGAGTIRDAAALLKAASEAAHNPAAHIELHYTGDRPLDNDEIDALVARWVAARKGANGGVAFTTKHVETKEHGTRDAHLMTDGRNAAAVDVARIVGIRAANIDATNAGASLTYETTETRGGELVTFGLSAYMTAITSRLSMDDVVPRGTVIRFDAEDQISPTGKDSDQ